MNKIFVLGVVVILSGSMMLPAVIGSADEDMDEKITVRVRTSPGTGTISEREVPPVVGTRLQSMISQLNNHTDKYKTLLPALLSILEDCGLIENAEKMELAIKGDIRNENDSIWKQQSLFFNIFCFVAGYGHGSMLMTPTMLLLKLLPLPISMLIFFYQTLRPRLFVPLGGWLVAEGKMNSIGLLGYQHFSIGVRNASPLPNCVLLIGFTGLWISILKKGVENEYFVGSAMAVFGG
ncbi:MAG: hypothetical protein J7J34_04925 [Thermoplasmata archaeon]|nr:hypothetical protein [Thermoplasmata archaeon]